MGSPGTLNETASGASHGAPYRHDLGEVVHFLGGSFGIRGRGRDVRDGAPSYDLRPIDIATPTPGRFVREDELDAEDGL